MVKVQISESKRKKKGSARSQMLKMVMPELSSIDGKQLQSAIQSENPEVFRQAWNKIGQRLAKKLEDDE